MVSDIKNQMNWKVELYTFPKKQQKTKGEEIGEKVNYRKGFDM